MNILVINVYNPPVNNPQAIQIGGLLRELAKLRCYDMHLFGADDSLDWESIEYFENFSSVFPVHYPRSKGRVSRLLSDLIGNDIPDVLIRLESYIPAVLKRYREISFDLVLSFGTPMSSHVVGSKLAKLLYCKHIAHLSDPWAYNPYGRRSFIADRKNVRLEADCFKYASAIIVTSLETKILYDRFYEDLPIEVIGHSSGLLELEVEGKDSVEGSVIIIRYIGSFYGKRNPLKFLKVFKDFRQDFKKLHGTQVELEFVGSISLFIRIRMFLAGLSRFVGIRGFVSYEDSLQLISESDLLLLIDGEFNESVFYPSKLADYLVSGKAIIGITPSGTSARLLKKSGHHVVHPNDSAGIYEALWSCLSNIGLEFNIDYADFSFRENARRLSNIIDGALEA